MCVWVEDADKLEFNSKELNIVFLNRTIKAYLNSNSCLGLAGIKGQGKTFLIKVKRKKIGEDSSVVCLPNNRMVDIIDSSFTIDKSLFKYLADYNVWVDLWKFSICGAVLTCPQLNPENWLDSLNIKNSTKKILKLNNQYSEAGFIAKQLMGLNINDFMSALEDTGRLFDCVKNIHQSVCFFFDKLDQGFSRYAKNFNADTKMPFRSRNASFWQYAQYGLAEAAYDIYSNTAHHIKVFYTIRQEALIDCEILNKDKARNINGFIQILQYSKQNLEEMYQIYIQNEEDINLTNAEVKATDPSKAFLGMSEIQHGYIPNHHERIFDYIYRHSFKRPYDIMKICRALFFSDELESRGIRHMVNKTSNELLSMYIQELETFLPCDISEIDRLIKMLPGNILNIKIMKSICEIYNLENGSDTVWQCNEECATCNNLQPFSILFNLGLIGYSQQHEADIFPYQEFKNIGNSILELNAHVLPVSNYYFLHPALSNKARDERNTLGLPFEMNNFLLIGDKCIIENQNQKIRSFFKKCEQIVKRERIFISSTILDLIDVRVAVRQCIKDRGLHPIMSEHTEFDLTNTQILHSHDHCIDQVLKCKSFIFIIGKEYGGVYKGEKYQEEKDEIFRNSEGKIKEPSISLMEFYVARKHNLRCYAFVSQSIDDASYQEVLSDEIKTEIKFLTHFTTNGNKIRGNWLSRYSTTDDLLRHIKNLKFI